MFISVRLLKNSASSGILTWDPVQSANCLANLVASTTKGPPTQSFCNGGFSYPSDCLLLSTQKCRPGWLSGMRVRLVINPQRVWQHSFMEIVHEIFSTVILSLPAGLGGSFRWALVIRRSWFSPPLVWQHSFVDIYHEMSSVVILIQEGSCKFLAKECAQILVDR